MTHHRPRALLGEPILHFVVLGLAAFGLYQAAIRGSNETIVVEPQVVRGLEAQRVEILGRPLTDEERVEIVEGLVEDEILLREAYRRGLERSDSRVRQRLLAVMRYSLEEKVPDPSRQQLEAFFEENLDRYWDVETVTFEHVYFPAGSGSAPAEGTELLGALARGAYEAPADPRQGIVETRTSTPGEIRAAIGSEAAGRLLELAPGTWDGPITSPLGSHYVKIVERRPLPRPRFEDMLAYVRGDWELDRRGAIRSRKVDELRTHYRIVLPNSP